MVMVSRWRAPAYPAASYSDDSSGLNSMVDPDRLVKNDPTAAYSAAESDADKAQALRALEDAFCSHVYSTALQYLQHSFDIDTLDKQFREIIDQDDCDNTLESACNVAYTCSNTSKNRYMDIVPYDSNRVELPSLTCSLSALASSSTINYSQDSQLSRSVGSWDLIGRRNSIISSTSSRLSFSTTSDDTYINASFLTDPLAASSSSECHPATYIATQGPLPNTVTDFWRMVISVNVSAVVMLTELTMQAIGTGAARAQCSAYFPEQQGDCLQLSEGITVTCVHMSQLSDSLLFRQLEIAYPADLRTQHSTSPRHISAAAQSRKACAAPQQSEQKCTLWVNHYKLAGWPDYGVPASTEPVRAVSLA